MQKDYYKILNVQKDATPEQIKSAYNKLALKFHPDRHLKKSEEEKKELTAKFQEIHEAYQILSDPEKRRRYDSGETEFSFGNFDVNDIFGSIFGSGMFGKKGGFAQRPQYNFSNNNMDDIFGGGGVFDNDFFRQGRRESKNTPAEFKVYCTLDEFFTGCVKKLKIKRKIFGRCEEKLIEVKVNPGYKKGTKYTFAGMGDCNECGAQDIVIVLDEKENNEFKRDGDDLIVDIRYTLKDFINGVRKMITLPGNRDFTVDPSQIRTIGDFTVYSNLGMPVKRTGINGNLKVRVVVENDIETLRRCKNVI